MSVLGERSNLESRLAAMLRQRVEDRVEEKGEAWSSDRLGISIPGLQSLLWRIEWEADVAIRVAEALNVLTERDVEALAGSEATAL